MQYTWLIWTLILLAVWTLLYAFLRSKEEKRKMLLVSLWTGLFGLTEPIFVPEYWMPPSLFNLAERTGFDIESLFFAFGIGGIAAVLYEYIWRVKDRQIAQAEKNSSRHTLHLLALFAGPVIFLVLSIFTDNNPIYDTIISLTLGGLATWYCRPDLKIKMVTSAAIFTVLYFAYFSTLLMIQPGYVERVWNLQAISGILFFGVPLEELMFAASFGFVWSSIYEHMTWKKLYKERHAYNHAL